MQVKMDGVADDLANVNTHGYKKKDISFQELLSNELHANEVLLSENVLPASINAGSKSGVGSINFSQGRIQPSHGKFHLAIEGQGFFGVEDENNNLFLTRNGGFHLNEDLTITDDNGHFLNLDLIVAMDEWEDNLVINPDGYIVGQIEGEDMILGRVVLYNPAVLDSLVALGEGRYLASPDVELYSSLDSQEGFGNIIQYALEGSNVEIVRSMADMITTQRAYSLNARAVQTTEDIMEMINNIKR